MRKKHIILVGIPSSGKSTLGKLAAEALGKNFVDIDEASVEFMAELVNTNPFLLLTNSGQREFLRAQRKAVENLPSIESSIVATGAETPLNWEVLKILESVGEIIHIKRRPEATIENARSRFSLVNTATGESVNMSEMTMKSYRAFIPQYDDMADVIMPNNGTIEEGLRDLIAIIASRLHAPLPRDAAGQKCVSINNGI